MAFTFEARWLLFETFKLRLFLELSRVSGIGMLLLRLFGTPDVGNKFINLSH